MRDKGNIMVRIEEASMSETLVTEKTSPSQTEATEEVSPSAIDAAKWASRRRVLTAAAFALATAGGVLVWYSWPGPAGSSFARYIYGHGSQFPVVVDRVRAAIYSDFLFVLGYTLTLGGLAGVFLLWAISAAGRLAAIYVAAAVAIASLAGIIEASLICWAVDGHNSTAWINAISTAATIQWCALLLALGGFPATVGIVLRWAAAGGRSCRTRSSDKTTAAWWNEVLWTPPKPTEAVDPDEASWVEAYNVPDAGNVIKARNGERVQAICLSGGGVRSACIAMGVVQEFSKEDPIKPGIGVHEKFGGRAKLIDTVDYVISVSGGGYTAGARLLATQDTEKKPLVSERFEEGSPELDHFRRGSSYIADSPGELVYALAVVFKNLLASITILFTLPALLGWVFGYLLSRPAFSFAQIIPVLNPNVNDAFVHEHPDYLMCLTDHPASWIAVAVFAGLAAFLTSIAMGIEMFLWKKPSERAKLWVQRFAVGNAVFAALVLIVVVGLPTLMRLCSSLSAHATHNQGDAAAAVSGLVGLNYLAAITAMAWKKRSTLSGEAKKLSLWKRLLPPGVIAMILVVVTLTVLLAAWLIILGCFAAGVFRSLTTGGLEGGLRQMPFSALWPSLVLVLAIAWISSVDVASISLNPFYRYRLGKTFAVRRKRVSGLWRAEAYDRNEYTWLPDFGSVPAGGPKFIFAAAAPISGKHKPAPGLNAVSYVISHDFIGGPELGWLQTPQLHDQSPPRIKRDLTVLTAVAASGAAFASAMGRQQKGFEKLLAVSGARLGTWLPNPNFVANLAASEKGACLDPKDNKRPWPKSLPYIRGAGYYYRELIGLNYPDARLVQVTDGGHYENLGLVEALRRRSRLIFCIDGGGDAPPLASGLADAMRLAEYELGVTIDFDYFAKFPLAELTPGSGDKFEETDAFYSLNSRLAKRTVAVGLITYPSAAPDLGHGPHERQGLLVFAKAVLCKGFPQWLLTYAASSDVFPHDPTSDQWFNEGQFAAYTQLGRIMGQQVRECIHDLQKDSTL